MKVVFCPVNGWDCPYFDKAGHCTLYPEFDPRMECDDFAYFWDEDEDYVVDSDEDYEPADIDDDCGFDPYMGCYTDDC